MDEEREEEDLQERHGFATPGKHQLLKNELPKDPRKTSQYELPCSMQATIEQPSIFEIQRPSRDELRQRMRRLFSKGSHQLNKEVWPEIREKEENKLAEECRATMQRLLDLQKQCDLEMLELIESATKLGESEAEGASVLSTIEQLRRQMQVELQTRKIEGSYLSSSSEEQLEEFERLWHVIQRGMETLPEALKKWPDDCKKHLLMDLTEKQEKLMRLTKELQEMMDEAKRQPKSD